MISSTDNTLFTIATESELESCVAGLISDSHFEIIHMNFEDDEFLDEAYEREIVSPSLVNSLCLQLVFMMLKTL